MGLGFNVGALLLWIKGQEYVAWGWRFSKGHGV